MPGAGDTALRWSGVPLPFCLWRHLVGSFGKNFLASGKRLSRGRLAVTSALFVRWIARTRGVCTTKKGTTLGMGRPRPGRLTLRRSAISRVLARGRAATTPLVGPSLYHVMDLRS